MEMSSGAISSPNRPYLGTVANVMHQHDAEEMSGRFPLIFALNRLV